MVTSELKQYNVNTIGKTYKATFEVLNYVSGTVGFWQGSGISPIFRSADGIYTEYFTSTSAEIRFRPNNFNGSVTNISVKEVGQDWTLGTGWSIGNDVAISDGVSGNSNLNTIDIGYNVNDLVKVSFTVSNVTGGTLQVYIGLTEVFTSITDGTYEFTTTATRPDGKLFVKSVNFNGSISNISVIEITDDTNLPRINYEGFSYQDVLGSEEVTNGGFDNGGSNWVNINNAAVFENSSVIFENNARIYQNVVSDLSKEYNIEIEFSSISGNGIQLLIGNGNLFVSYSVSDIINNGNKINIVKESFIGTGILFIYSQNSDTSATITNVSVKEVLGQEVVPDSGCGHWLWEPQTTQLLSYSEDFSQWNAGGDTTIESGYLAPDGTNNAYKISGTTSALTFGASLLTTTTRSIYARTVSGTGQAHLCSFNSNSNNLFTITEQWQRFEVNSATTTAAGFFYAVDFRNQTNLSEIILWGANATNDQDYATSYIPSNGSTVTRNQDVCTNGGSLASINSTEGTLYFEGSGLVNGGVNRYISISDNTSSNRVQLVFAGTTNRLNVSGANFSSINYNSFVQTNNNKIAFSYSALGVKLFVNGVLVGSNTDNASFTPNTLTTLDFALWNQTTVPFFGKTKCLAVWKEALSDEELTELTTI